MIWKVYGLVRSNHFQLDRTGVNSPQLIESSGLWFEAPGFISQEPQAYSLSADSEIICCMAVFYISF